MSANYYLYPEARKNGETYFYFKVKDAVTGKWSKRSTGIRDDGTKKARLEAERIVLSLEAAGVLLPRDQTSFSTFTQDFWKWDKCEYLRARLARDPKAISPEQAYRMRKLLDKHVLPHIGALPIQKITTDNIDRLVTTLLEGKLSSQSVVHILDSIRAPFSEARRRRLISFNPMADHMAVTVRSRKRDAITVDEAKKLLDPETISTVWASKGDQFCSQIKRPYNPWKHWAISMLGACTGRRINEILAIHAEDIDWDESIIHVHRSIGKLQGLKEGTKTGKGSHIPVAPEILQMIKPVLSSEGYIFQGYTPGKYLNYQTVTRQLQRALKSIGVSWEAQAERLLGFHSWRHFFNTRARAAGLSNAVVQAITEHRTIEMTDHYTQFEANDLKGIMDVQRAVLG